LFILLELATGNTYVIDSDNFIFFTIERFSA